MLIPFTDLKTGNTFALNPKHIIGIFIGVDGEAAGKTMITVQGGTVVVEEDYVEVFGRINGEMR
jgi:uncharacterized protein YlzI (FlbEa/FlbD family)